MRHAATRELFSYWNILRQDRAAPERADVDPAAIRGVLADTFILDVDAARLFPVRLAGTRLNALFTVDLKGRPFVGLWTAAESNDIRRILNTVMDDSAAVIVGISAPTPERDGLDLELLLLPLRHHGKTHARVLGCLSPARIPSWLGLLPIGPLRVMSLRVMAAGTPAADGPTHPAAKTLTAPVESRAAATARHGHLIVHEGGAGSRAANIGIDES